MFSTAVLLRNIFFNLAAGGFGEADGGGAGPPASASETSA